MDDDSTQLSQAGPGPTCMCGRLKLDMRRRSTPFLLFAFVAAVVFFLFWRRIPLENSTKKSESHAKRNRYKNKQGELPRRLSESPAVCAQLGIVCESEYFVPWNPPSDGSCSTMLHHGYPVPDPRCTPGGIDPSVTVDMLKSAAWRTRCIRNCETSEAEKHMTYTWYDIRSPRGNHGKMQICELDHLVPLELGGADGLGNIWPECGPPDVALEDRYFKAKDRVENYLAHEVKTGRISLQGAQRGIAEDWTRFLDAANSFCASGRRCN